MIPNIIDFDQIRNNLSVEQKMNVHVSSLNNQEICVCMVRGETVWHETNADKFIFVMAGTIAIDFDNEQNRHNLLHQNQGMVLLSNQKYRLRAAQASYIIIIGREDRQTNMVKI